MTCWLMKLTRSGYPATTQHQTIREAVRKFERMCEVEDIGGRPTYEAREWQSAAQRLEKENKSTEWHKMSQDKILAALVIITTPGSRKFGDSPWLEVGMSLRAERLVRNDAKLELLRKPKWGKEECLCYSTGNPGGCEKNSVGYMIECFFLPGGWSGGGVQLRNGRNSYSRGMEHQDNLQGEKKHSPGGNTASSNMMV